MTNETIQPFEPVASPENNPLKTADVSTVGAPSRATPDSHRRGSAKLRGNRTTIDHSLSPPPKPDWIRIKFSDQAGRISDLKGRLRESGLHTVCEEAACPNLAECFSHGTATFMILGDICTRRCPFCDVAHGRPKPVDTTEPERLASAVSNMGLRYVVITSVDRDDLRDGGAAHFAKCVAAIRNLAPHVKVETLVPDFRGRLAVALDNMGLSLPEVLNHNLETVPRLYRNVRPGADYEHSLLLLQEFGTRHPQVKTKSGLMLGIGESRDEVLTVMDDLRAVGCEMLTLGQYLRPSREHLPVTRYLPPDEFLALKQEALSRGFVSVASAPLVRSSYHADEQARALAALAE